MVNTDNCVTVKEFSDKADISRQAVNKMIKQGKLRATMIGKTYLIEKHQLDHYLKASEK